jgi:hypothetical protein
MQMIQSEEKTMTNDSLHREPAVRASLRARFEGRLRRPLALLLSGLMLIGVFAPFAADTAYGMNIIYTPRPPMTVRQCLNVIMQWGAPGEEETAKAKHHCTFISVKERKKAGLGASGRGANMVRINKAH